MVENLELWREIGGGLENHAGAGNTIFNLLAGLGHHRLEKRLLASDVKLVGTTNPCPAAVLVLHSTR